METHGDAQRPQTVAATCPRRQVPALAAPMMQVLISRVPISRCSLARSICMFEAPPVLLSPVAVRRIAGHRALLFALSSQDDWEERRVLGGQWSTVLTSINSPVNRPVF